MVIIVCHVAVGLVQISLELEGGVGVSLINSAPEELVYAILRGVKVSDRNLGNTTVVV